MKDKYYTPTLDEFHPGFEFENRLTEHDGWIKCVVEWETIESVFDDYEHVAESIPDLYRVKYLDRTDLESEGWELNENNSRYGGQNQFDLCGGLWPKNGLRGWWLSINKNFTGPIKIQSTDGGMNIDGHNYSTKFYGTIKNISELRRLQKQLGIN